MDDRPILFFDSGVGGLAYLERASERLPNERFVYLADRKYFPYGEKEPHTIKSAVLEAFESILPKIEPKCAVIACNTASVVALGCLRERYPFPFIGVVPAVKPAALVSSKKRFGVLATQRTVSDEYLANLIASFANNCEVHVVPAPDIVDIVEKRFFTCTEEEKLEELGKVVADLKRLRVDSVVLGCTHFLHLLEQFKSVLGADISVIDSRDGVVNQLIRVLVSKGLESGARSMEHELYVTGASHVEERYEMFASKYGLKLMGRV